MFSKKMQPLVLKFILVAMAYFTGCMATPGNGDLLADKGQNVAFEGFVLIPNEQITISALNPSTNAWETIATAQSVSFAWYYNSQYWHQWDTTATIPARFWSKSANEKYSHATLRANAAEGNLYTYKSGFQKTWSFIYYPTASDAFIAHGQGTTITIYAK